MKEVCWKYCYNHYTARLTNNN